MMDKWESSSPVYIHEQKLKLDHIIYVILLYIKKMII